MRHASDAQNTLDTAYMPCERSYTICMCDYKLYLPVHKDIEMQYYGDVYRPPSEAYSLIIQATLGCSQNSCAFCSMYKNKNFYIRPTQDVISDLKEVSASGYANRVRRIFLADGDALIVKTEDLVRILDACYHLFPSCERVTSYASPRSLLLKTDDELKDLRRHGLKMVYLGLESGNDAVLKMMRKGFTAEQIIEAGKKAKRAQIMLSVTAISGLGGSRYMSEHALDTARVLSAMNPEYIGLLTLEIGPDTPLKQWVKNGEFNILTPKEVLLETKDLLSKLDSPGSIFRMNHASNYLNLAGTMNTDRQAMIKKIDAALSGEYELRPEWMRRL